MRIEEGDRMRRVDKVLKHEVFQEKENEIEELERDRIFCKHGLDHRVDVARLAYIFDLERGCGVEKDLIYACALLHDIGRGRQYIDAIAHAEAGLPIAREILQDADFGEAEVIDILYAISKHSDESSPGMAAVSEIMGFDCEVSERAEKLSEIIYDADKLSRECYRCKSENICKWSDEMKNMSLLW